MTTRAHRRPARFLAVLALSAPIAGVLVAVTPGTALASQSSKVALDITDGTVFGSPADVKDVTATGTITNTGSTSSGGTLVLDGPTDANGTAFHSQTGISGCSVGVLSSSCSKSATAKFLTSSVTSRRNGHYTASVGSATKGFYTNFPPTAAPGGLTAAANGNTAVDLSWSYTGTEPDGAGFEISESKNGTSTGSPIHVSTSACNGTTCGYELTYSAPGVGQTDSYSYTVTALRSSGGCSSCGDYTRSAASSSASAQLVGPPPPPSPTPTPTDGGTTGASTGSSTGSQSGGTTGSSTSGGTTGSSTSGGTTSGSTGTQSGGTTGTKTSGSSTGGTAAKPITIPKLPPLVASRRSFALGFNHFSPSLGIPKLPPLPATTFPVTAGDESSGGVYQPQLPYKNGGKKTTSVLSSPIAAFSDSIGLDKDQLMTLVAIGLVLFAAAAHVRLFLSHSADD